MPLLAMGPLCGRKVRLRSSFRRITNVLTEHKLLQSNLDQHQELTSAINFVVV
jgi:hypothetical protein